MAKDRKTDFSSLSIAKTAPKKVKVNADAAVNQIHQAAAVAKEVVVEKKQEPIKRVSVELPVSLHKKVKIWCYEHETNMKEFFIAAAKERIK